MRLLLLFVMTTLSLSSLGCAPLIWTAHHQEMEMGRKFRYDRVPLGPWQQRTRIKALPDEARPEELKKKEEKPVPIVLQLHPVLTPDVLPGENQPQNHELHVHSSGGRVIDIDIDLPLPFIPGLAIWGSIDQPPPGPPLGRAPLQLQCTGLSRSEKEQLEKSWDVWTFTEKAMLGVVTIWDLMLGAAMINEAASGKGDQLTQLSFVGAGAIFLGDAAGLVGLMVLMPESEQQSQKKVQGQWKTTSQSCPAGLWLNLNGRKIPVDQRGQLKPDDEAWLVQELVLHKENPTLHLKKHRQVLDISLGARCAWGRQRGLRKPLLCPAKNKPYPQQPALFEFAPER